MSQQSGTDDGAVLIAVVVLGAMAAVVMLAVTVAAFAALAAWFGFTVRYPRKSAHMTMWVLMGVSIIAGFGVLWHYLWLWDIPPFRAWFIASLMTVIPVCGLVLFINVTSEDSIIFWSIKTTICLLALGGLGYWLFNGGSEVYNAVYCEGILAEARAPDAAHYHSARYSVDFQSAFHGGEAYRDTFKQPCGTEISEALKTGFYFSCFWFLSALYFPFGLIHAWTTKKRNFTLKDMQQVWDKLWGNPGMTAARELETRERNAPSDFASAPEPPAYEPPPFGGRP